MTIAPPQTPRAAEARPKAPRDPRLDFYRGIAMFIILLAHTPSNTWTLWIPARFGFSDATEIFVFCSGMASAMAFGTVFAKRGYALGILRVAFRIYQVYWAHIGVFLVTAIMLFAIDHYGVGAKDTPYITAPYVVPLFEQTGEALIGLFTLSYVPGLFDILPMYLVILAMIPAVMAIHHWTGTRGVVIAVLGVWLAANLAGYAWRYGDAEDLAAWQQPLISAGEVFSWMLLPSNPFGEGTWFFNPFGWQLVFFAGFAFGMGWLPAPPVSRRLVIASAVFVLAVIPLAWFRFHGEYSILAGTFLHDGLVVVRDFIEPLRWKTWQGAGRFLHFLALAYLAWVAVGPHGVRLSEGFAHPKGPGRGLGTAALAALVLTLPVAYPKEIALLFPGYDAGLEATLSFNQIGMLQLLHLFALIVVLWGALGDGRRHWAGTTGLTRAVPVIRKVGSQSLAVFMVSIPLSRFNGWLLDHLGADVWSRAAVNLWGFAVLIGVAYFVGWIRRQPWREPPKARTELRGPGAGAAMAETRSA
ncbi:MAG: OpgC family protein [Paracoccaceae bacterium]